MRLPQQHLKNKNLFRSRQLVILFQLEKYIEMFPATV